MDYSTGFADADGKLAAQGLTLPGHLGSVPTAMESIMRHFRDDMAPGDVFIMNDPFDGGMHLPDIFVIKPLYPRGRAAGLRLHGLPPHRRRRPGGGIERVGLDRDLRRGPAHRADEALRRGQAQPDHHDVHREERPPAGAAVRRPARPARGLPHRREAVRRDRRALRAAADEVLPQGGHRLCRAADARGARASCPTANGASRTGSTTTASTTASRSGCSSPSARRTATWWSTGPAPTRRSRARSTTRSPSPRRPPTPACARCCRRAFPTTKACSAPSR